MGAFKIIEYRNRSGTTSYQVYGTRDGKRLRKNFQSRPEAEAHLENLLGHPLDEPARTTRLTWLNAVQIADAEAAARLLVQGESLLDLAKERARIRRSVHRTDLKTSIREFIRWRRQSGCRQVTLEVSEYVLDRWRRCIRARTTTDVMQRDVEGFIFAAGIGRATQKDRRKHLFQFCKWAARNGHMASNLVEDLPTITLQRQLPAILTVDQARRLIGHAATERDGYMLGYFAVCLFAGIRPTEARKLTDSAFLLAPEHRFIEIGPEVAKMRQCRRVELPANLTRILRRIPRPIVQFNERCHKMVRYGAGLLQTWQNDIMRHTFASYHWAMHEDLRRLEYIMGNSERVLFQNYIRPVRRAEARAFFAIRSG